MPSLIIGLKASMSVTVADSLISLLKPRQQSESFLGESLKRAAS